MDMEDSLDSLFGSVENSPTSRLGSSVAEEDKQREARLYRQTQSGGEDVDSLLSELRSARGGSMARTAANVFDTSPTAASSKPATKPRGRRRRDDGNSLSKDAASFLESGNTRSGSTHSHERSSRLGGAAAIWLDAPSASPSISPTQKSRTSPSSASSDDGTCRSRVVYDASVEWWCDLVFVSVYCVYCDVTELGRSRTSPLAQRAAHQALDPSSASARGLKNSPKKHSNLDDALDDRRRSNATSFAAQEAMKTAEQAREAREARKAAKKAAKREKKERERKEEEELADEGVSEPVQP